MRVAVRFETKHGECLQFVSVPSNSASIVINASIAKISAPPI